MHWFISSLLFVALYFIYSVANFLLAGGITGIIFSYFKWLDPYSKLGGLLIFLIIGVPIYILMTLFAWIYIRNLKIEEDYPSWLEYLRVSDERGRRTWPLLFIISLALVIGFSLFAVLGGKLQPIHWSLALILWWGMLANYLSARVRRKEKAEEVKEEEKPVALTRITAKKLVDELKNSRIYRGQIQIVRQKDQKDFESKDTVSISALPLFIDNNPFLKQALRSLGIKKLYEHQKKFCDYAGNNENTILATPIGSGRSTICDLMSLFKVLVQFKNVLYIYPNQRLGEHRFGKFSETLKEAEWEWSIKAVKFLDKEQAYNYKLEAEVPEVIFTTPDVLHHFILRNHKDWEIFLRDVGLIVLDDLQFYHGVYGTNCAFVFRRLLRICEMYGCSPQIIGTATPVINLAGFVHHLTGKSLEEKNIIKDNSKGSFEKRVIFWNPSWERRNGALRRSNYYEEAKNVLIEVFFRGFDTLVLSKSVQLCESDINGTQGEVLGRLRELAKITRDEKREELVKWMDDEQPGLLTTIETSKDIFEQVFSKSKAQGEEVAEGSEGKKSKAGDIQQYSEQEMRIREKQQLLTIESLEEIEKTVKEMIESLRESFERNEVSDRILAIITESRHKMANSIQGIETIFRSDNEFFAQAIQELSALKAQIDAFLNEVEGKFEECKAEWDRITERIDKTTKLLTSHIYDIIDKEFDLKKLDACIMTGLPGTLQMVQQEVNHIGGGKANFPADWFLCIVVPQIPLYQYYKNHPEENFLAEPSEYSVVNLGNRDILKKHLLCMIYENELKEEDITGYMGDLAKEILEEESLGEDTLIKKETRREAKMSKEGLETPEVSYFSYTQDNVPHTTVYLTSVSKDIYKIVYAPRAEEEDREVGAIEYDRRHEKTFPGAIIRLANERYSVTKVDEANEKISVALESHQLTTEKINEVKIKLASFIVFNQTENKEVGRLDEDVIKAKIVEGDILAIGKNFYKVEQIDRDKKAVYVKNATGKGNVIPINLERPSVRIGRNPQFPIRIGMSKVRVEENIIGYNSYNFFDIEDERNSEEFDVPKKREFTTQAVYMSFSNRQVQEKKVLHALAHLVRSLLPTVVAHKEDEVEVAFCENHPDLNEHAIFIYDNCANGIGIANVLGIHHGPLIVDKLLEGAYQLLVDCPCREGCPGCLHIFACRKKIPNTELDKKGALELLGELLSKKDYKMIIKHRYDKIDDDEVATKLRNKIFAILKGKLNMVWKKPATLVVDTEKEEQLEKELGLTPRAGVWTDDTLVIREYPEDYMVHIIAHEYTHDWEGREGNMDRRLWDPEYIKVDILKNFERTESIFTEGFCEWVSFRSLDFYGLKYEMERYGKFSPLPLVYKAGFEVLKYIEDTEGAMAVVNFIKDPSGYDIEKLYEKSGVKDYISQIITHAKEKNNVHSS